MALSQNAVARLAEIAKATRSGGSCYSLNDSALSELTTLNLVVVNSNMVQHDNITGTVVAIAARATDQGLKTDLSNIPLPPTADAWGNTQSFATQPTPVATAKVPAEKPTFVIESFDELPEIVRNRGTGGIRPREAVYPWEHTNIGQRFFIPAQFNAKGNMIKHYSAANSTNQRIREAVQSALDHNARYPDNQLPVPTAKHFKVFIVTANTVVGNTVAPSDGEYVYCLAGIVDAPKPREAKTE